MRWAVSDAGGADVVVVSIGYLLGDDSSGLYVSDGNLKTVDSRPVLLVRL